MNIGFCGLLFIVFLVLKLMGVIAWSWLWVTSPIWLGILLWLFVVVSLIIITTEGQ